MEIKWADDPVISFRIEDGTGILSANADGLRSLAAQFSALAEKASCNHIHYDAYNAFEDGSDELIVEKTETD